jgi:hypothetical protein
MPSPIDDELEEGLFQVAAPIGVLHLGQRLSGVPAGRTRLFYLLRRLEDAPVLPLVRLLACGLRESAAGTVEARLLIDTFGALLAEGGLDDERREQIASAALEACEHGVLRIVQLRHAEEETGRRKKDPLRGSLAADGETLGRRKSLARTATGDPLDKVLRDPHPDVIRNAMLNPRLKEALVVRLAARRPISAELLDVVAQSRFQTCPAVRRALAMNPHCDPALACRLLANLTRGELRDVAHDEGLSSEVREAARLLLEVKPPRHVRDTSA